MTNVSDIIHPGCNHTAAVSEFDQNSWIIAICLAILAAVSNNLGVNFQKLAWTQHQKQQASLTKFRIVWTLGMAGIILASVFDFVALAFGPQSVIAPIGALTIVMNGCVASYLHGEKVTRMIVATSIVICSGCAIAVAAASHENVICDLDGIFYYFAKIEFAGYCIFMFVVLAAMELFARRAERIFKQHGECSKEYGKVFAYHRLSYAFMAGMFGSISVVFARAIGQLAMSSSRGGELFLVRWETYLILLGLVAAIVMQMVNLNKGLSRFESSYNVPTFTGTFIVTVAVSGGVVYGEFANFSLLSSILFPVGVLLCVFGVFALTWNSTKLVTGDDTATTTVTANPEGCCEQGDARAQPISEVSSAAFETKTGPTNRTLRIHSGGFSPFNLTIETNQNYLPEERRPIRGSLTRNHHHGVDLLTGLYLDDTVDSPTHSTRTRRRMSGQPHSGTNTPTVTPRGSMNARAIANLATSDLPQRSSSPSVGNIGGAAVAPLRGVAQTGSVPGRSPSPSNGTVVPYSTNANNNNKQ